MNDYAKIWHTKKHGQILVMRDFDDEGDPAVLYFSLVCGALVMGAISFMDDEGGRRQADKVFKDMTLERITARLEGCEVVKRNLH